MKKNRILLIGPIVDFGGREVMTNLLVNVLKDTYTINVLSTTLMTKNSVALKNLSRKQWSTLSQIAYDKNVFLKLTALLAKVVNKRKEPAYFFINNKFSKLFFNFDALALKAIKTVIKEADLVIYSDEITGRWLESIIKNGNIYNIPILAIITGKIKVIPKFLQDTILNFNILVHSKQNAKIVQNQFDISVLNVDQTSAIEEQLLKIEIKENADLVYGFIGRFSPEKGTKELVDTFSDSNKKLIVAGSGPLLHDVKNLVDTNDNFINLGELSPSELPQFFNKIDVLIIPSHEEGGPLVGVEAMAAGKLVLSTKVGAMPERMEGTDNDFWFFHDVKYSLETAISTIEKLSKPERLKIRQQLRDKYVANNSLQSIKKQYLDVANQLINKTK
ncbi:glycosyltransferase family 4 protein [Olleya namhaensis]|uniref:glycosyltransferase family 4 protein n=1 Tax=Olleya namhaensis TaxID=1144750 RepID=UPI002490DE9B|nr:glycosyltransferase [Olleya namhaensis]